MKTIAAFISVFTALLSFSSAQPPGAPAAQQDLAAVVSHEKEFEAAYARGDAKSIAGFFTEDADYTTEDGRFLNGRAAIQSAFEDAIANNPGAKLDIVVQSVRPLTDDVVEERGSTTVTGTDGSTDSALYTAIQVRKDGKWFISELTETDAPTPTPHDRLSELAWIVGSWAEDDGETTVKSSYNWARGGNFITRNVTVKKGDDVTLEGWQIIGWDQAQNCIRSWTFDSEGGFSEATWSREGDSWLARESGTIPDGSYTTADNTITKISDDRFSWESNNRTLDGDPEPSIDRIVVDRVK